MKKLYCLAFMYNSNSKYSTVLFPTEINYMRDD